MSRFDGGWIKIYRSAVLEDIGRRGNFTLGVFVRILCLANWRESSAPLGAQRVVLKPGQIATGLRELCPNPKEDPEFHRTRGALTYLEQRGTIAQVTSNQGRIITLCNWNEYQTQDDAEPWHAAGEAQAERIDGAGGAQHSEEGRRKNNKNHAPRKTKTGARPFELEYTERFEEAWDLYGGVGKKKYAFECFERLNLSDNEFVRLKTAIQRYRAKNKGREEYLSHFSTFLNEDWRTHLTGPGAPAQLEFTDSTQEAG